MIIHSVAFSLKEGMDKLEKTNFLMQLWIYRTYQASKTFIFKKVSLKILTSFFISMEFKTDTLYKADSNHPQYLYFIQKNWIPFMVEFLDADNAPPAPEEF
jgi:hypothetical protein